MNLLGLTIDDGLITKFYVSLVSEIAMLASLYRRAVTLSNQKSAQNEKDES